MTLAESWYEADNIYTLILKLALLALIGFIAWLFHKD